MPSCYLENKIKPKKKNAEFLNLKSYPLDGEPSLLGGMQEVNAVN